MKYGITLIFSLFISAHLLAQVANDDCSTAIDLGMAPACDATQVFSNLNATASSDTAPDCFAPGGAERDVWFTFTAVEGIEDYRITIAGTGATALANPQLAIYRGSCDGLAELLCTSTADGATELILDAFQLTPGATYFLRVGDAAETGTSNAGSFTVCVEEAPDINLISDGGSNQCTGTLYDTGGPDGNYGNNEEHIYVICPDQPHNCLNLSFTYYNLEYDGTEDSGSPDQITIFDGEGTTGEVLAVIGGGNFVTNGLSDGGAVCFETQATSGCMTIVFQSDASVNLEGFEARWECSALPCTEDIPIAVDLDVSEADIADAIRAAQTELSVTNLDCPEGSYGTFTGDNTDLGLGRGIILATGDADYAIGPNVSDGADGQGGGNPGDADLDSLSVIFGNGSLSQDACILELEVFANTDELIFEYVFGSEEYPEYVNQFNDIFAFLISGPGIDGLPQLNGQENIAVLPNANSTVVQIDSVNGGVNYEYYRNNDLGRSVEYDGLTSGFLGNKKSLTARASVIPCNTYQLKLAIADREDDIFDSGVFVSDIRGGAPEASIDFASGIDYLVEDCSIVSDTLVITLNNGQDSSLTYQIQLLGSATPGEDYIIDGLPDNLVFTPGENEFRFPIEVLSDLIEEGQEEIIINFVIDFGCGATTVSSLTVNIEDNLQVAINAGADQAIFCDGDGLGLIASGAASYSWSPAEIFDDPFAAEVFATPATDITVQVVGALGNCTDTASIFLEAINPMINILNGDSLRICEGDTVQLMQENNLEDNGLLWSPDFGFVDATTDPNPRFAPQFDTWYSVSATIENCTVTDSIFVDVDLLAIPELVGDTVVCEGYDIQLATVFQFAGETEYEWTPGDEFVDPTDPESILNPTLPNQEYTLISTTRNGACADTQRVVVDVIPSSLDIINPDTIEVCAGFEPIELRAIGRPGGGSVIDWFPDGGGQSPSTGETYIVQPDISVRYFATYTVNGCFQTDSVLVKVDSLPNMEIMADPFKDPYCQGDTFFLRSPIYDVGDYPGILHSWIDAPGLQTGDSLYNGYVTAQDTSLFMRISTNGACVDTNSIQINVVTPPAFELTPLDTAICPGGSVQYNFRFTEGGMGSLTWTPTNSLSCSDCFDPVATPLGSTTYMIEIMAEGSQCTFPTSATVSVIPDPDPLVPIDPTICLGESQRLLLSNPAPGVDYRITGGGLDTTDPTIAVSPTENTTYTLTAMNACTTVTRIIELSVVQEQTVAFSGPSEACIGDEVTYEATTTVPLGVDELFTWYVDGVFRSSDETFVFTADTPGNVQVRLVYSNGCQTIAQDQILFVAPPPALQLPSNPSICAGESIPLNLSPNAATTTYSWSGPDGFTSTDPSPVVSPTATATYTVTAITSDNCPTVTGTVTVEVIQPYTLTITDDLSICSGDEVTLTATLNPEGVQGTFAWTGPGLGVETGASITVLPTDLSTYTVSFTDAAGCFGTTTASTTVSLFDDLPPIGIGAFFPDGSAIDSTIFGGSEIILVAGNPPAGVTYTYEWFEGETSIGTGAELTLNVPNNTGIVTYRLVATSEGSGCTVSATISLEIVEARYAIPTLISPNRDGQNDGFRVFFNGNVTDYTLIIFNRWGQQVFTSSDPDEVWDGTRNGDPQPMDLYLYRVRFNQNGLDVEEDGEFTLVR